MKEQTVRSIDRPVALVLLGGMIASTVLIAVGVLLFLVRPVHHLHTVQPVETAVRDLPRMQAPAWLSLGIFALIITPVVRVVTAIGSFAWVKDWKYVLVSVVVLISMVAGLAMGKG